MTTYTQQPVTREHVERFAGGVEFKVRDAMAKSTPAALKALDTTIAVEHGKVRARIVRVERGSRSVFCFVDYATGDILKAASWKAPAKHARGNINTPTNGVEYVGQYGPAYLR